MMMTTLPIPPTVRDVDAAYHIALASLRDVKRCRRDYGPRHEVTRMAEETYAADEAWWHEVEHQYREARS